MSRVVVLAVVLAGCGFRIAGGSGAEDGGPGDGASDGRSDSADDGSPPVIDAPIDGPQPAGCIAKWLAHTISFETPTALATLTSTSFDRDPYVSTDELTIWWSNGGATSQGGADVFSATRANRLLPFSNITRDAKLSTSGGYEGKMSMTSNALYAVVSSSQSGGAGAEDLWEASRSNAGSSWGNLGRTHLMALETTGSEFDPFVSANGLQLYYAPIVPSPQHIVVAKRNTTNDNFNAPANVTGIVTTSGEADPTLFAGERVIAYATPRNSNNAGVNIWYATRANDSDTFGTPVELTTVNSNLDDGDPHVTADGCAIYFSRNVGGGVDYELFSATAPP